MTDYTKLRFPVDIVQDCHTRRLFGTVDGKVIGAECLGSGDELRFSQAVGWNADGTFADGQYPHMNLPADFVQAPEKKL